MTQDNAPAPSEPTPAEPGHAPEPAPAPAATHETAPAAAHSHETGEQTHFSPEEWQEFRDADKMAGAYIVVLMQGIFMVGLVLYLIVLWSVV
jgi:hypothetical protein